MSSVVETRPAGWRPDPSGRYEWRYWDNGWTNRVANSAPNPSPTGTVAVRRPDGGGAPSPGAAPLTAPGPSAAELAVLEAVRTGHGRPQATATPGSTPAAIVAGFGTPPAPAVPTPRPTPWTRIVAWFRAFVDEPESYHSAKAGASIPPHPAEGSLFVKSPANYGRAGLVALAACGLGVGAYLPWLSGTIDALPFERTGFELGKAGSFTWLAAALAVSAIIGVRLRPVRWVNMGIAVLAATLTAQQLVDIHDLVTSMNTGTVVKADVGVGLWIMVASAAGALIASFRIGTPEEIG